MYWQTSRRRIELDRPLLMAILNVTPDSFSDGGKIASVDEAVRQAERFVAEGAGILDVGGESTRPRSERVSVDEEIDRVVPVIQAITDRFDISISIDTSKAEVAEAALGAGAEIINDISGLRFDERIAEVAARTKSGLILMHSRGEFETMHTQEPVADILADVCKGFRSSLEKASAAGVEQNHIVLDVGIGFGKTLEQNLELIGKLDRLIADFPQYPMLVGASRKSFIGKILDDAPVNERLRGSLAVAAIAIWNGAKVVRVHDVAETLEMVRTVEAIRHEL
ncbi:MAG: dihydropteroate synthase [Blastocatellia bacterium]|nr:dihydropteroate synthase [Blastocatellia bacterium]